MPSEYEFMLGDDETYITVPLRKFEISKENVNQSFDLPKSLGFEIQNVLNGDSGDVSYNNTVKRILLREVDTEKEGDKSGNTSLPYNEEFSSTILTIIEETLSSERQTLNENQSMFLDTEKEVIKLDTRNTLGIINLSSDTNKITKMGIELSPYDILHRAAREPRSVQGNNSNSGVKVADENNHTGKEATNNHSLFIPSKPGIDFTTDDEMWINVSWGNLDQILKSLSNFGEDSPAMLPLEKSEENIETFMNQRLEDIKTPGERGYQDMYLEDDEKEEKKEASESGMPLYFYSVTIPTFIAKIDRILLYYIQKRLKGHVNPAAALGAGSRECQTELNLTKRSWA
uniref:Uncharacterized protein n=1 Tax=Timema poppense TaxID=170557 RepID=A0A7R9HFG1_TIMPO|nr:unnamed protein product [Timema poppensis]